MADRVELEFRRAAERLLADDEPVLVAVSGGGDSVALLHLFRRMAVGRPRALTVAHLDHGLRRGSLADRRFVERLARECDLPCIADRRDVGKLRQRRESPEEAARRVRRAFLLAAARACGARRIATGHTLDDQAETVLMRLVRGAGPSALAGMRERGPGPFVRPLLGLEREALRAFLRRHGLRFRDDPSNLDLGFDRNRVRRLVLPLLRDALNPRAARRLVAAAERLRRDAECLDGLAATELERLARPARGGGLSLDARALAALDRALAGRVARLALERVRVEPRRVASRHVDALLALAAGPGGKRLDLPGGLRASCRAGRLTLRPA